MKSIQAPKSMFGPWRGTVVALPEQFMMHVSDIVLEDTSGGVESWRTLDWMSQDSSLSFASTSIAKQRSIVQKMERIASFKENVSNNIVTGLKTLASSPPSSQEGQHRATRVIQPISCTALLFGHTNHGDTIAVQLPFQPWIHIRCPPHVEESHVKKWLASYMPSSSATADRAIPARFEVVRMRPFFGVTPDPNDIQRPRLNTYFRFFFNTCDESAHRQFALDISKSHLQGVSVDNAKITPYSRLIQHLGFAANQWIKIECWSDAPYYVTNTQVEIVAHRRDMSLVSEEDAPLDVEGTITATIFSAQYNNVAMSPEIGYPDLGSIENSLSALHVSLNVKRSPPPESIATSRVNSSAACWTDLSDHFTLSNVSAEHRERYQLDLLQRDIDSAACSSAGNNAKTRYCFLVDGALQNNGSTANFPLKIALFESGSNDEVPRLLLHVVPFEWMALLCLRDLLYYASVDIVLQHDAHVDGILQWHARVNMASSAAHEADGMREIGGELFQTPVFARYGFPLKYGAVLPTSVFPSRANSRHPTLLGYCSKMAFKPCQLERSICKSGREDIEVISYKSVPGVSWIDTSILVRKFKDEEDQTLIPPFVNMNDAIRAYHFHELIGMCQSRCEATDALYYTGDMPTGLAALSKLTGLSVFDYLMKSNVAQFWSLVSRKSFQMGVIVDKNTLPTHFNMRGGYIFSDLSGLQTTAELVPDFQSHYLRALIDGNICPSTLIVPFDPVSKDPLFQSEWTSASGNNKAAIAKYDKAMEELSFNLRAIYGEAKPLRHRALNGSLEEGALLDERNQSHIDFLVPRSSGVSRHVDPRIVTPNCNDRPDEITPECHFVCPSQFQSAKFECEGVMPSIFKEIGAMRSEFDAKCASLRANHCVGDKWESSYHEKRFNNAKANSIAAKLIGNASYGVLVLVCPHAAQATTDFGRRLTLFARDVTLKQWHPSALIYTRMKHFYDECIRRGLAKQYDGSPVQKSFRYLCRTYADHRDEFPLEGTHHADYDRPFQISLPGKDSATSVWPISVNVGHTDSIGVNLFFLLPCPDGKEVPSDRSARCNTKHHYTLEQRALAFDIGKHMASFVTSLLRSALLDNVTLQFGEMLYPFILSNSSKISYSGIQWKDFEKPASETPKMIQMGTSRRLPLYVGRLIDESVTQLLHSLNPQLVHKAMILSVQDAVNRALSATSVSQLEEFSMCETLHMPKDRSSSSSSSSSSSASSDIVSPHSAANEILKLFAPHAAYRYGASIRYVPMASGNSNTKVDDGKLTIFGGVKMRPSLAGCMSLRQLRIMESNQRFISSESVATAASSSEKTPATKPLHTPYTQVYWMDNNQLRTLRVDGEAILKRCSTALHDVIYALGDNDGKGWVDPAQSAMLGWTTGCVARSIQQSAVSVASKGKFSKSVQVPAITNFFKRGGAK